jgi:putative ABC transport system ATP-binding protein
MLKRSHTVPGAVTAVAAAARAVDLKKTYGTGDAVVRALDGVDIEFASGGFTAVMGPSGSGKSTLMHCMAGLDVPTSGRSFIGDQEIGRLDDASLTELRRDRIGFVFQSFNLVPTLTAQLGEARVVKPADLLIPDEGATGRRYVQARHAMHQRRLPRP